MSSEELRERVLREAEDWVWVPPDAEDVVTEEYRLVAYPDRTAVPWSRTSRLPELVEELSGVARRRGHALRWWVNGRTRPEDTDAVLEARGFAQVEHVDVVARAIDGLRDDLGPTPGVTVRPADDEADIALSGRLGAEVFGWEPPTSAQLAHEVGLAAEARLAGRWPVRRFLAYVDEEVVGTAGYTLHEGTVRLWGGAVVESARGRGAYRALLAARCDDARRQGCDLALVKGRVETSGPVLRRAGFTAYDAERCFQHEADLTRGRRPSRPCRRRRMGPVRSGGTRVHERRPAARRRGRRRRRRQVRPRR